MKQRESLVGVDGTLSCYSGLSRYLQSYCDCYFTLLFVCLFVECRDNHQLCPVWARGGQCQRNGGYMLRNCQKSCEVCWSNMNIRC